MADGQATGAESFLPRDLHELAVANLKVLDLCRPEALEAVELSIEDIAGSDWTACQEIGKMANYLGLQGVRAPSATGSGIIVAVFEPRVRPGQLRLIETRQLSSYL